MPYDLILQRLPVNLATLFFIALAFNATPPLMVGAQNTMDRAVPPLHHEPLSIGEESERNFAKPFLLKGAYYYGYLSDDPNDKAHYATRKFYFVPEKSISARLPRLVKGESVDRLSFSNQEDFIRKAIPSTVLEDLGQRKIPAIYGVATALVDRYTITNECNTVTYTVRFLSLKEASDIMALREPLPILADGCPSSK